MTEFKFVRQPLRGIVVPLATPLRDYDTLDVAGTERLIEHVIAGGVRGIFILGTTGEAPSLAYMLRSDFIRLVCSRVAGRVPVMVGVTDTAFVQTLEMADAAMNSGASALVLSAPYYFPAGQTELTRYVRRVVEETMLPIVLYNMPSLTKVQFDIETLEQLSDEPRIVGVKDSGGDLEYFRRLVELKRIRPDWTVMIGPEHLMAQAVAMGGDGGVNGGANIMPKLFCDLFAAADRGDAAEVARLMAAVERLQAIYDVGKYASRYIKATKCALSLAGICGDAMAEPFNAFYPEDRRRVQEILASIGG